MFMKWKKADASFPWSGLDVSYWSRVLNAVKEWRWDSGCQFVLRVCIYQLHYMFVYMWYPFLTTSGWQLLCLHKGPLPQPLGLTAHMALRHVHIGKMALYAMTKAAVFLALQVFEKGLEPPLCNSVWQLLVGGDFSLGSL